MDWQSAQEVREFTEWFDTPLPPGESDHAECEAVYIYNSEYWGEKNRIDIEFFTKNRIKIELIGKTQLSHH